MYNELHEDPVEPISSRSDRWEIILPTLMYLGTFVSVYIILYYFTYSRKIDKNFNNKKESVSKETKHANKDHTDNNKSVSKETKHALNNKDHTVSQPTTASYHF
jgi:F0F1-type ATP synthase membrane subunit b/b'